MQIPVKLKYTKTHEWVEFISETLVRVGLTDYAQSQLGDLVFINLPVKGDAINSGETLADVESVKAVEEIYSPVSGEVTAVNDELADEPEQMNSSPYEAWIAEISEVEDFVELMDADEYEQYCKNPD